MLDCGIRQCELCGLQRPDVDFINGRMKVYEKGDKERFAPIGSHSLDLLDRYYTLCPYQNDSVFVNKDESPLSNNAVKLFTHRLQKKLGFKFSSHGLCHTYATISVCIASSFVLTPSAASSRTKKNPQKKLTVQLPPLWLLTVRSAVAMIPVLRFMISGAFCLYDFSIFSP